MRQTAKLVVGQRTLQKSCIHAYIPNSPCQLPDIFLPKLSNSTPKYYPIISHPNLQTSLPLKPKTNTSSTSIHLHPLFSLLPSQLLLVPRPPPWAPPRRLPRRSRCPPPRHRSPPGPGAWPRGLRPLDPPAAPPRDTYGATRSATRRTPEERGEGDR